MKRMRKINHDFSFSEVEMIEKAKPGAAADARFDATLMNSGMYLAAPILIGLAIGYFADRALGTRPTLTVVFIVAGTVSSFYNLYRIARPIKR